MPIDFLGSGRSLICSHDFIALSCFAAWLKWCEWWNGLLCVCLGEAGNAARMMLILNMVQGSFMATIAEGLTLAQATGQSQQTFLDILCQGQMASTFVDQKCQSEQVFPSFVPLCVCTIHTSYLLTWLVEARLFTISRLPYRDRFSCVQIISSVRHTFWVHVCWPAGSSCSLCDL